MNSGYTIERKVNFQRGRQSRITLERGEKPEIEITEGTVPRISKLMALAIHLEGLLASGEISDQADLARLGHVTRARVTQIMNLSLLAPDIQEEILFLPLTFKGRDSIRESHIRPICIVLDWRKQRRMWKEALASVVID
ncbi:MAG: hypothetical protein CMJ46_13665 [Planctomyces sp.]|nr:hypothetical protein [Planctomyces sp.]